MKSKQLFLIFVLCLARTPCLAQQSAVRRVNVDRDRLSVDIKSVPLFEILQDIAAETGMEVKVDPEVNKTVTVSFENAPIDRGIARLIHPLDYVIKWKRITTAEETVEEVVAVEIFRKGERDKAQQVLSSRASPREHPRGAPRIAEDYEIEESRESRRANQTSRSYRHRRKPKPRKRQTTTIKKPPEKEEPGEAEPEPRTSSPSSRSYTRIRTFETISSPDTYDELSP